MMRPKKSVNDLEEALRESTPPKTAVPHHFRQQLRHDLLTQATPNTPSLSRRWLLAPVALLIVVIVAFWYGLPKTAVEPAIVINTTRPAATPVATSAAPLSREQVIQKAFTFGSYVNNKPTGGWLVDDNVAAVTTTAVIESYDVALNRLGSFAIADFGGSNIFFPENRVETVWFVQLVGRWQPFGGTADMIEPSKYVGVLVNPDTGDVLAAGSSTVPFLTDPIILSLAAYPPQEIPYFVNEGDGFWLVHTESQLLAFDPRSPLGTDWSMANPRSERCLYGWVMETNGRFTDPCSGDEWELDGTLNLAESTELWNDRNLDQYRLEVDDDTIIVHLDEIIYSDVIDTESLGTLEEPQTDFDTIIEHVNELAERRQAFLTNQTGWLHTSTEEYVPLAQRGDNGLIRALFPTEQMMLENWYHAVGDGRFDQNLTRYFDANGNLTQASMVSNGRSLNFTLNEIDNMPLEALILPNDATYVAQHMANSFTPDTVVAQAYVQTVDGRNHYFLQVNTGSERKYIFDWDNGRLLSQETTFIAASGERILNYRANYLQEAWQESLPDEAATLLAQGQTILDDPNNGLNGSYTWDSPTPTPDSNPLTIQASHSKYDITVSVVDVAFTNNEVVVTTLAQVAPIWQMNANAFPPQQALAFGGSSLQNQAGLSFTITQSEGRIAEMDSETGGLRQATVHHFAGGESKELMLATAVELTSLYRAITLPITLDDAEVGQTWSLDWPIPLGAAQLVLSEVVWEEETAVGTAQLRLTVVDNNPPDLILNCLHIATTDPWQNTCSNDERSFVVTVPTDKPVQLHLRANIDVTGFELHWQP